MSTDGDGFLEWREEFVSQERGNRVVHYFLKDTDGESILAVVGTERSLRHMVYVVADEFLQVYGPDLSINSCVKWRSRREVVDWLTSLLVKQPHPPRDCLKSHKYESKQALGSPSSSMKGLHAPENFRPDLMGRFARELKGQISDIVWSGDSWTCGKQLTHYPAFCRSGTVIAIHSFVLIMAKEENHYLAYLEDMYEDRKGQKKVKVRWFHYNREVEAVIRLRNPHPREVFITPNSQVISVECVDGRATVLTPEHYEKCLAAIPHIPSERVYFCFRQFRSNKVKAFDLSKLKGYIQQPILSCLEDEDYHQVKKSKQGPKKIRSCRGQPRLVANRSVVRVTGRRSEVITSGPLYQNLRLGVSSDRSIDTSLIAKSDGLPPCPSLPFKVGDKIELLCQDSGIRGCWFRCTISQASRKLLKVQYDDLPNEDEPGNVEEWIPAFRLASPDKLGMRCLGRLRIRPYPPEDLAVDVFEIGSPVDAWWSDGWWEGVVTGIDNSQDDSLRVYFPGENRFLNIHIQNLRRSRDWVGNQWIDIKAKPDIHSAISAISAAVNTSTKFYSCSTVAISGGSAMSDRETPTTYKLDTVEENKEDLDGSAGSNGMSENLMWVNNSRKRPRIDEDRDDAEDESKDDDEKGKVDSQEVILGTDDGTKRGIYYHDGTNCKNEVDEHGEDGEKNEGDTKDEVMQTDHEGDDNSHDYENQNTSSDEIHKVCAEEMTEVGSEGTAFKSSDEGNEDIAEDDKVDGVKDNIMNMQEESNVTSLRLSI